MGLPKVKRHFIKYGGRLQGHGISVGIQLMKKKKNIESDKIYFNDEAESVSGEYISFSFGANWLRFLDKLDQHRIKMAQDSFCNFTKMAHLKGHTFLDIGCGSGLSSLVALLLGATRIISVDIDPNSIAATNKLRSQAQSPSSWEILRGSIIDPNFVASLPKSSFVYCWGVLHHTGNMWRALENVSTLVDNGGYIHISIYNHNKYSPKWLKIKRIYNKMPRIGKLGMGWGLAVFDIIMQLCRFNNPMKYIYEYSQKRGMSWYSDLVDWLGGLPYEYAKPEEVFHFLNERGFELRRMYTTRTTGCNEFLFIKV